VVEWYSDTLPENWLLCNGQAVSRTDYAELFNVLGTKYGIGDGSSTFNLPNLQGKIPVGKDSNDTDFNTLGKTGGEKRHTLTLNEIPIHNHGWGYANSAASGNSTWGSAGNNATGTAKDVIKDSGGGQSHNNLQPYTVCNFMIKAKQSIVEGITGGIVINKTNVDVATATLSSTQRVTTTTAWEAVKVNFDNVTDTKNLTLLNGGIKIGKGISKVLVSTNLIFAEALTGRNQILIRKNNKTVGKYIAKEQDNIYMNLTMPAQVIDVTEEDVITLIIGSSNVQTNKAIVKDSTYMTIVAIKDDEEACTSDIVVSSTEPETDRRKVWFQKGTDAGSNAIYIKNDNDIYEEFIKKEEKRIITGEEFETNEYIDGKRVYRKIINLGAGPNNNSKSYAIGVEASKIVKLNVNMKNEIVYIPLGFVNTSVTQMITYYVNETNLVVQAGMDRSDYKVIAEIYYTK